ncbi:hypothetical protein [Eudoraea chungangensis]|uniref:hypothetical protein n=1 Tax=Eudoraea chungangensis TaxID=1481905 RepID=UPI0023EBB0AE|nr:hypothetical protein [Eudoraea chungangensis]
MKEITRKIGIFFSILFMQLGSLGLNAQSTAGLILPDTIGGTVQLQISGYTKENVGTETLAVFLQNQTGEYNTNAIQGSYKTEGKFLMFKPYFPFEIGTDYIVKTRRVRTDNEYHYQTFNLGEKKSAGESKVMRIFPEAHQLPDNILRFYIYFNTPMKKGQALDHIKLIDAEGNIDEHAFMEFKQELWSADGKRLTLLFDPGRIKRGVSTNLERGPALLEGNPYTLKISSSWQDVYGQPLSSTHKKEIQVVKGYRQQLALNDWKLTFPLANSLNALIIDFDRTMDHALLQSMLKLVDSLGNNISGKWEVSKEAVSVQFIPESQWKKGNYQIIIDSRLEDVAGNNLQNLLDYNSKTVENNNQLYETITVEL